MNLGLWASQNSVSSEESPCSGKSVSTPNGFSGEKLRENETTFQLLFYFTL